jgi:hypothetical protein
MQMIRNTADKERFCVQVSADRGHVRMHSRPNVAVQPGFAILGAEDNVNDDLAEGLGHCRIIAEKPPRVNRAFSARKSFFANQPWGVAPGWYDIAPLARNSRVTADLRCPNELGGGFANDTRDSNLNAFLP